MLVDLEKSSYVSGLSNVICIIFVTGIYEYIHNIIFRESMSRATRSLSTLSIGILGVGGIGKHRKKHTCI